MKYKKHLKNLRAYQEFFDRQDNKFKSANKRAGSEKK